MADAIGIIGHATGAGLGAVLLVVELLVIAVAKFGQGFRGVERIVEHLGEGLRIGRIVCIDGISGVGAED